MQPVQQPNHQEKKEERLLIQQYQQHSGPLPTALEFDGYEKSLPGSADRILAMAENEGGHRRKLEEKLIASEIGQKKAGQYFAMAYVVFVTVIAAYFFHDGKLAEGQWLFGGTLITIATIFGSGKMLLDHLNRGKE